MKDLVPEKENPGLFKAQICFSGNNVASKVNRCENLVSPRLSNILLSLLFYNFNAIPILIFIEPITWLQVLVSLLPSLSIISTLENSGFEPR